MQTRDYARAALWDTAIKFSLQSRTMTSPDHLDTKGVHGKTRLDVSFLEYGRHVGQPRHCRRRRRRAYAPTSTTASQDNHEINSWVSSGGRGQLCLRSHATAHPMILTIITSLVSRSVKFQWPPKDDTKKVLHLMIAQRI